jgi:hypothetical protein
MVSFANFKPHFLLNKVKMHINKNMTTLRKVRGDVDLHVAAAVYRTGGSTVAVIWYLSGKDDLYRPQCCLAWLRQVQGCFLTEC